MPTTPEGADENVGGPYNLVPRLCPPTVDYAVELRQVRADYYDGEVVPLTFLISAGGEAFAVPRLEDVRVSLKGQALDGFFEHAPGGPAVRVSLGYTAVFCVSSESCLGEQAEVRFEALMPDGQVVKRAVSLRLYE